MVRTASLMPNLGTKALDFSLPDVISHKNISLPKPGQAKASLIMFICNHCPYVKHISHELTRLANEFIPQGIAFIAINSNDVVNYPDDSPENMRLTAIEEKYPFPYLYDETQEVAQAYQAVCTPDFFLYDSELSLVYRGQLDDARPGNTIPPSGESIREALCLLLAKKTINIVQKPSLGCNIKWRT